MDPQVLTGIVQTGGLGVALWMLFNVWQELKVQNQWTRSLVTELLQVKDASGTVAAITKAFADIGQPVKG